MSLSAEQLDRLHDALCALRDNRLEPDEREYLQSLVLSDSEARRLFVRAMHLRGSMLWKAKQGLVPPADQPSPGQAEPAASPQGAPSLQLPSLLASQTGPSQSPLLGFLGTVVSFWAACLSSPKLLAITVIGGLATYFLGLMISIAISRALVTDRNAQKQAESPSGAPARIVAASECRWQDRSPRADRVDLLPAGTSHLVAGSVELEFDGGARVRIEGPAEFAPRSGQRMELARGRLMAYVPKRARGFTVDTPSAEVVDVGTEFGVEVDGQGHTDLHVIRGRVEITPLTDAATPGPRPRNVIAGEAVRVAGAGQSVVRIPIDQQRFSFSRAAAPPIASRTGNARAGFPEHAPIWLGNLFDDPPGTPLAEAIRTDTFQAVPAENGLGIERVIQAEGRPTKPNEPNWVADRVAPDGLLEIAPGVMCNLKGLGWSGMVHGNVANDASSKFPAVTTGGLRTRGEPIASNAPRIEEGIGMHADSLLTFDLDEIRAAGGLEGRRLEFVCDRAGVNDDDPAGIRDRASLHVAALVSDEAGVQTAVVNGNPANMRLRDGVWVLETPPGEPLKADGRFVLIRVPIAATAKYLTLVASSADGDNDMDHAAWSGARLEVVGAGSAAAPK